MSGVRTSFCFFLSLGAITTSAQCPVTDYTIAPTACIGEYIQLTNASVAGSYEWDFCSGDFQNTPTAQLNFTLPGVNGAPGIEFVHDGTKWFGFFTGTYSNLLYRLEFDNGLQAAPTATVNLGNLGIPSLEPGPIRIVKEGGNWYGLLLRTTGELVKLSFGSQLTNTITTTSLLTGIGYFNSGLSLDKDPIHGWVCVISNPNNVSIIRLGNSMATPNPGMDVLSSAPVPNPNGLGDIDLVKICGNWFGLAVNYGNGNIYRLDFGSSLFSLPAITQLLTIPNTNPGRLRMAKEGESFFAFIVALDGTMVKLQFGNDITSVPTVVNEGNIGGVLPANMYGLAVAKDNSTWTVMGVTQGNGQVYKINYPDNCGATPGTSTLQNPTVVYSLAGTYAVSLNNSSGGGVGSKTRSITVSSLPAPDIDFTSLNNCAQNAVLFTSQNVSGNITTYSWAFGDAQVSSVANPSHSYATAGDFSPRLSVVASNGCSNTSSKMITMYNPPLSDFVLPAISPVCTNQNYMLTNTSTFDLLSNPLWEWRVNGLLVSTQQDLGVTFTSAIAQEIRLKALIPGCENEVIKNIATVLTGPLVDFAANDDCEQDAVLFTNSTTGADAGYIWNFGDGSPTSALSNPSHNYTTPAVFQVTLTGSNVLGCQNQKTKAVRIYSLPQPDFDIGLPPFSCSNTPTPFQNNTPPLTDSNIVTWSWTFGDPGSGTSSLQNPAYTYLLGGNYVVGLTANSDFGCTKSIAKSIVIGTSPVADFSVGPSCLNLATLFTDNSSGGVQSRFWQIASATFTSTNPSYTFTSTGDYSATLTATNSSGCTGVRSRMIHVPVPPALAYSTINACAGKAAVFTDETAPSLDPVTGWSWNFAGNSAEGNPATYVFISTGIHNVKMTTAHVSGCKYTLSKNITINPTPSANFSATPDRGAPPLTIQFSNSSTLASQYQWTFFDKVTTSSTLFSPVYTFTTLGDYTTELRVANSFGCYDIFSMPILVLEPSVDLIMQDFSLTTDPATGNMKGVVTILNGSNIPVSQAEVSLVLSNGAVINETLTLNIGPGQSATRTLSFSLAPGQFDLNFLCAEILSEKDVQPDNNRRCISIDEQDHIVAPFPNPSNGELHIDWIVKSPGSVRVVVFNSMGQSQYEWESPSVSGLNQSIHDLTFLSAGMYFITVQTSGAKQTTKFLRQ